MCSSPGRRSTQAKPKPIEEKMDYGDYAAMVKRSNASYEKRQLEKQQHMLNATHPHVKEISINKVACPLHILQLREALKDIQPQETLEVTTGNLAVQTDLLSACHALGHKTNIVNDDNQLLLYITKGNV